MQDEITEAKSVSQLRLEWRGGGGGERERERISWEDGAKLNKKKRLCLSVSPPNAAVKSGT